MDIKIDKKQRLEALYKPYLACLKCPLGFLGRTQIVFGSGNPDAKLMLIGEAPGKDEDLKGEPFVGRSGTLLENALKMAGIDRADIFITNIVKCRPPKNRKPVSQEIKTCKKLLLDEQINIVSPKVICTLGSTATEAILEQKGCQITKIRGLPTPFKDKNVLVIPTYHPAYILRNPKEISTLIKDLVMALKSSQKE